MGHPGDVAKEACVQAGCGADWALWDAQMANALKQKRYRHSLAVADTAVGMGRLFGGDLGKLAIAGLLHDGAKELGDAKLLAIGEKEGLIRDPAERANPSLLHGPVAAWMAPQTWRVDDPVILDAIRLHTTGAPGMGKEACIVFMADLIEPGRVYPDVVILRKLCGEDLREAMMEAIQQTFVYLAQKDQPIHGATRLCLDWLQHERSPIWKAKI